MKLTEKMQGYFNAKLKEFKNVWQLDPETDRNFRMQLDNCWEQLGCLTCDSKQKKQLQRQYDRVAKKYKQAKRKKITRFFIKNTILGVLGFIYKRGIVQCGLGLIAGFWFGGENPHKGYVTQQDYEAAVQKLEVQNARKDQIITMLLHNKGNAHLTEQHPLHKDRMLPTLNEKENRTQTLFDFSLESDLKIKPIFNLQPDEVKPLGIKVTSNRLNCSHFNVNQHVMGK